MNKQQVMFVETQGEILKSLKSSLMGKHTNWQILFMADAAAALDLISQRQVDVVLASFGMHTENCEDFFCHLREKSPQVIRVGLLADQEKGVMVDSLEYAHTCVAAHCDAAQMESLIARSLYVRMQARGNPQLAQLMSSLDTIPTPPALYFDIRDELESPNGTANSVAEIISKDPALTAKLLKVANSGFYGGPRTIANMSEAVTLLGVDLVLAMVLSAHLYNQLPIPGLNLDELWKHSIAVATLAKEIAAHEQGARTIISNCAISGLLHDLGQLVFLANMPETYFTLIRDARGNESELLAMELEEFGVGHPELGALILSLWGLPEDVVQSIANHHMKNFHALPDVSLTIKAVWAAESMLQSHGQDEVMGLTDTDGQTDLSSMLDGLVQWGPLMDKLAEKGLIPPRKPVDNMIG